MIQFSQHTLLNILHMHGSQYQVECHNWHTNLVPVTEGAGGYSGIISLSSYCQFVFFAIIFCVNSFKKQFCFLTVFH